MGNKWVNGQLLAKKFAISTQNMMSVLSSQFVCAAKEKSLISALNLNSQVRSFVAQLLALPGSKASAATPKQGHQGDSNAYIVANLREKIWQVRRQDNRLRMEMRDVSGGGNGKEGERKNGREWTTGEEEATIM